MATPLIYLRRRLYKKALTELKKDSLVNLRKIFNAPEFDYLVSVNSFKSIGKHIISRLPENITIVEKKQVTKILCYHFSKSEQEKYLEHFKIDLTKPEYGSVFRWLLDQTIYNHFSKNLSPKIYEGLPVHAHTLVKVRLDVLNRIDRKYKLFDKMLEFGIKLPFYCDLNAILFLYTTYYKEILSNTRIHNKLFHELISDDDNFEYPYVSGNRYRKMANDNIALTEQVLKDQLNEYKRQFPVCETLLTPFTGKNITDYKFISHKTLVSKPRITEYLQEYSGMHSSQIINLFNNSKNRAAFISLAEICKDLFVDLGKRDYSINLLSRDLSFVEKRFQFALASIAEAFTSGFTYFFSPEQNFSLLSQLVDGNNDRTSPLEVARKLFELKQMSQVIDIKFSNINTWSKLNFYISKKLHRLKVKDFTLNQEKYSPAMQMLNGQAIQGTNLVLTLPQTNYEIFDWGLIMHNCLGSSDYGRKCANFECFVLGVFEEGKIKYCVEIDTDGDIVQMEAKYKGPVVHKEKLKIYSLISKAFKLHPALL